MPFFAENIDFYVNLAIFSVEIGLLRPFSCIRLILGTGETILVRYKTHFNPILLNLELFWSFYWFIPPSFYHFKLKISIFGESIVFFLKQISYKYGTILSPGFIFEMLRDGLRCLRMARGASRSQEIKKNGSKGSVWSWNYQ